MEYTTLKELCNLHTEQIKEAQEELQELLKLGGEDWNKIRTAKGNISRGRQLRTNLLLIQDRIDKVTSEITQQIAEVRQYTALKDLEVTLRRKSERTN